MKDITYLQRNFMHKDGRLLILSVTKYCNMACKYCKPTPDFTYDRLSLPSSLIHLPKEDFFKIKEICSKKNVREVTLTGGEPVEYPYLLDLMIFLKENNIRFSLHTNGTSRNWASVVEFFKQNKFCPDIHISVELFDELQKEIRGKDMPYDLIKDLVNVGCNIELKVTIHQKLLPWINKIENSLNDFMNCGVNSIRIQPVFFPCNLVTPLRLNKSGAEIFSKFLEIKKNSKYTNFIRNTDENLLLTIKMLQEDDISKIDKPSCVAKDKVVFMQPDGQQVNCLELWGKKDCQKEFDLICCGFVA